jgi:hypothetical protein
MPESGFQDSLILAGWKQVVPYSGDLEVKRIFGEPEQPADDPATGEDSQTDVEQILDGVFGE